ncbi:MAG: Hsp20/alpha crystallin family protein [Actinomycetota bacterium]|nr:Hsp20/alpha crystallin family protein [Actinomycetota bacterium]
MTQRMSGSRPEPEDIFQRFFGIEPGRVWPSGGYSVPTDIYRSGDRMVVRMDLPGVSPQDVDVTAQENVLVINGRRDLPVSEENVQFLRRGTFYGEFTERITLGRGLDTEKIGARFDNGVLELSIPYAQEVRPRKISIDVGDGQPQMEAGDESSAESSR